MLCGESSDTCSFVVKWRIDNKTTPLPEIDSVITVSCGVPIGEPLTVTDNCGQFITAYPEDEYFDTLCENNFQIRRTWTFQDSCGNSSNITQIISVEDTEMPELIGIARDTVVYHEEGIPAVADITASDNCGYADLIYSESQETLECGYNLIRHWTAIDPCGNSAVKIQTIRVEACDTSSVKDTVDLALVKTVNNTTPNFGDRVKYQIHVTNHGPAYATGIEVIDFLPNGLSEIKSISHNGVLDNRDIIWQGISVPADSTIILSYTAEVLEPLSSISYKNVAEILKADQYDEDSFFGNDDGDQSEDDEDSITIIPDNGSLPGDGPIDIELIKTVSDSTPGIRDVVTYTIAIQNSGDSTATGIEVVDYLPVDFCIDFKNISHGGQRDGDVIRWSDISLLPNEEILLTFETTISSKAQNNIVINKAEVVSHDQNDVDSTPGNGLISEDDCDMVNIKVGQISDLSLTKDILQPEAIVGDTVTFHITLRNEGPDKLDFAEVEDIIPDGYGEIHNISEGGIFYDDRLLWFALDLSAHDSLVFSFDAKVIHFENEDCDYRNIAQVIRSSSGDPDSTPGNYYENSNEDDSDSAEPYFSVENSNYTNNPPIGGLDELRMKNDRLLYGNLLANDFDPDGDILSIDTIPFISTEHGELTIFADGSFMYTPDSSYTGTDQFSYIVCDDGIPSQCDTVQALIEVLEGDDENGLYANDDISFGEEEEMQTGNVLVNDYDPEGDSLSVRLLENTINGTLELNSDGSWFYMPFQNITGTDEFIYEVCDAPTTIGIPSACDTAAVTIHIIEAKEAPQVIPNTLIAFENTEAELCLRIIDANNGDTFTASLCDLNQYTSSTYFNVVGDDLCIVYTPPSDSEGSYDICFTICDQTGLCDTIHVPIMVISDLPTADSSVAPVIINTEINVLEGEATSACTVILDANEGDTFYANLCENMPSNGNADLSVSGNRLCIDYAPHDRYYGSDSVCVVVCDEDGLCDTILIPVNVIQKNTSDSIHVQIDVGIFLEGPYVYEKGTMSAELNSLGYLPGQLPITFFGKSTVPGQPYYHLPWKYEGKEGKKYDASRPEMDDSAGYPHDVVDYILLSIRTEKTPESKVYQTAGMVYENGDVSFFDEGELCYLDPSKEYYVVIQHRNHLVVMSHEKVPIQNGVINYDFRKQNSFRGSLGSGQKEVDHGVWAMFAGNGDQANTSSSVSDINVKDMGAWLQDDGKNSSYYFRDYDLNGDVNVQDKGLILRNNGVFSDVKIKP